MQSNDKTSKNLLIANKYKLIRKLKTGGFGAVYISKTQDQLKYAIKLMPIKYSQYAQIQTKLYQQIKSKKFTLGFIKYYESGKVDDQMYLVMELIGLDLQQVMTKMKNKRFSVKTVLMIGLQLIDRIQALHTIGYVHRDIKPDNLAIGNKQNQSIVYLFDFGLAAKEKEPTPKQEVGKMIGTLGFMSITCHQGKKSTFYDDIQSFVYTLIYLLLGELPWMKINIKAPADYHRVKISKQGLTKDWFKKNKILKQIFQILQMAKEHRDQKIDYLNIKYKLLSALQQLKQQNDFMFDWIGKVTQDKDDSPIKRVIQRKNCVSMNKFNQNMVQGQIYQIYKFIGKQEQKQPNLKIKPVDKITSTKQKKQDEKHKKFQMQQFGTNNVQKDRKRPQSNKIKSVKHNHENKQKIQYQLQQKIRQFGHKTTFEGPRIVINRTAQHKI